MTAAKMIIFLKETLVTALELQSRNMVQVFDTTVSDTEKREIVITRVNGDVFEEEIYEISVTKKSKRSF